MATLLKTFERLADIDHSEWQIITECARLVGTSHTDDGRGVGTFYAKSDCAGNRHDGMGASDSGCKHGNGATDGGRIVPVGRVSRHRRQPVDLAVDLGTGAQFDHHVNDRGLL
jgi:hypothetical protein